MTKIVGWAQIPYSEQAQQFLSDLPKGTCAIVRAKHINDPMVPKVQIEFAEKIVAENRGNNVLADLNKGDNRFSQGARRNWSNATLEEAKKMGVVIPEGEASAEILAVNPKVQGENIHVRVVECTFDQLPRSNKENAEYYEKRTSGEDGQPFFTPDGKQIYQYTNMVYASNASEVDHILLEGQPGLATTVQQTMKSAAIPEDMNALE